MVIIINCIKTFGFFQLKHIEYKQNGVFKMKKELWLYL